MKVRRLDGNPIIRPHMDARMGDNINGPSLIRVPGWVRNPLGRYYLYFAHHQGTYIRLAFADDLEGPWRIHASGVLDLEESFFDAHIASPDVHVLDDRREIRMYYHGCCLPESSNQVTRVATSADGISFIIRYISSVTPAYSKTAAEHTSCIPWRESVESPSASYSNSSLESVFSTRENTEL